MGCAATVAKRDSDETRERRCHEAGISDLLCGAKGCEIPKTEERGITVTQLEALLGHISRRCEAEGWVANASASGSRISRKEVNLYDTVHHVIKPVTRKTRKSFVELVSDGPQVPVRFVSHWWGEPVSDFVACLSQHAEDHALGVNSPYWVCAYANNQWKLSDDLVKDPGATSFRRAMHLASGTVSVLDREAMCYRRVWCSYEVYISLLDCPNSSSDQEEQHELELGTEFQEPLFSYEMYTSLGDGKAVGITDGPAAVDRTGCRTVWKKHKCEREMLFPQLLAERALKTQLQDASASKPADRRRILNAIAGREDLDATPPAHHERYEVLNCLLRGRVAMSTWRVALEQGSAMAGHCHALKDSGLEAVELAFSDSTAFNAAAAGQLSRALPHSLRRLDLDLTNCQGVTTQGAQYLARGVQELPNLSVLALYMQDNGIGDEGAAAIAHSLHRLRQLESLTLYLTKNSLSLAGVCAVAESLQRLDRLHTLRLTLNGNSMGDVGAQSLADAIGCLPQLRSLKLSWKGTAVGDDGALSVAAALQQICRLQALILLWYKNNVTGAGAMALANCLAAYPESLSMAHVNLRANRLTGDLGRDARQRLRETFEVRSAGKEHFVLKI